MTALAPLTPGRHDGWTPDRQRTFVEGIAGGDTVEQACRRVGLAVSSAYALRRRANGAAFALAWDGARLLAREALADTLLTRALEGQEETITRADGSTVTRYLHDNRLATHMLHRLDRFADAASASAHGTAARLVAGEFDAFLDLLGTHAAPARAGLFLGTRLTPDTVDGENTAPATAALADLAPILALARADRYLRTRAAHAAEVPVADLDPANRAQWSAEQWTRAEAAGLVALAPPPAPAQSACEPPLPPLRPELPEYVSPADRPDPVWWCDNADAWRTRFPPPDFFMGEEDGEWGDPDYQRELDDEEIEQLERPHRIQSAVRHITEGRMRDRWFADAARVDTSSEGEEPNPPVEPAQAAADGHVAVDAAPATLAVDPCFYPEGRASDTPAATDAEARTDGSYAEPRSGASNTRDPTFPEAQATDSDAATTPDARTTTAKTQCDAPATDARAATRLGARAPAIPAPDPPPMREPRRRRIPEHARASPVVAASTARGSDYHGLQAT